MRFALALAAALLCGACVRQVQPRSRAAVPVVTTRHTANAVDAGDGDFEIQVLRKRLAADVRDIDSRILLARLYARRGFPDVALEHYRLALAQFPDSRVAALELAKTLREMGETKGALETVQAYMARHPGAGWEFPSLAGILHDEQGDFASAEASYRVALALDSGQSAVHNNLGYNLLLQAKPAESAAELRKAIEMDPHSEIAHNNLGAALALAAQPQQAVAEWQRSAGPAAAHNNLAAMLIEQGRYAEARVELQASLGFRRDFAPALANLQFVSQKDGQPAMAATPPQRDGQHVNLWRRFASRVGIAAADQRRGPPAPDTAPGK
jgi:Tfp pilus assembly protein PilF